MKVNEIITVHAMPIELSSIDKSKSQLIKYNNGLVDNYQMFKTIQDGLLVFYCEDNGNTISAIIGLPFDNYLQIKRVFVRPQYRKNNLALHMYHAILYSEYKNLMSDTEQTSSGKKIWQDLARIVPIKSLNLITKQYGEISDAYQENEDVVLVTDLNNLVESILTPSLKYKEYIAGK